MGRGGVSDDVGDDVSDDDDDGGHVCVLVCVCWLGGTLLTLKANPIPTTLSHFQHLNSRWPLPLA
jgi:hypothetical protein